MRYIPTFKKNDGGTYRIIGVTKKVKRYGYAEPSEERYNVLQRRSFLGWKNIEYEHIPEYVSISLGCLGYADWKSELIERHLKDAIDLVEYHPD